MEKKLKLESMTTDEKIRLIGTLTGIKTYNGAGELQQYIDAVIESFFEDRYILDEVLYTEEDMEECFEESRLTNLMVGFKYDTFEDFINRNK